METLFAPAVGAVVNLTTGENVAVVVVVFVVETVNVIFSADDEPPTSKPLIVIISPLV